MSQKKIHINPAFFSVKKNTTRRASTIERKKKPVVTMKPNKLKKQLLGRIKEYQKRKELDDKYKDEQEDNVDFESEFDKSLGFLQEITRKKTSKNRSTYIDRNKIAVSLELPTELCSLSPPQSNSPIMLKKDSPYGCLKNGTKPTYREWKSKTQSNPPTQQSSVTQPQAMAPVMAPVMAPHSVRQHTLEEIKLQHKQRNEPFVTKRTKTLKYKLGKRGKKVSILIKDRNTRKRVQEEHTQLKKKSMLEIKNYLKQRNLLRVGSNAPNDVIRHMYEQSVLCGDLENMGKDNLVHNFLNDT
jgi:hypothetical protein